MWAALTADGTELVYNWEDPILHVRKRDTEKELASMAELAGKMPSGVCARAASWWKTCRVEKVVLVRAKVRKPRKLRVHVIRWPRLEV